MEPKADLSKSRVRMTWRRQLQSMGHPVIFLRHSWALAPDGSNFEQVDKGGPPLGIFPASQYFSGEASLQEGDVLVLYTDGISEASNEKEEEFGEERLRDVVRTSLSLSAMEICQRIVSRVNTFTAGCPQADDITLAVIKVNSQSADETTKNPELHFRQCEFMEMRKSLKIVRLISRNGLELGPSWHSACCWFPY
jgi:stage II sporulation SpoE-like protein